MTKSTRHPNPSGIHSLMLLSSPLWEPPAKIKTLSTFCSEEFSEKKLKDARMANRLVQEGSDARLEAMFGDGPSEGDGEGGEFLPDSIGHVSSWEDGAAEVAKMIGAEVRLSTVGY